MKKLATYVFYRGDDPVFTGTAEECAAHFNISVESVSWLASPASKRRAEAGGDDRLYAERVKDVE